MVNALYRTNVRAAEPAACGLMPWYSEGFLFAGFPLSLHLLPVGAVPGTAQYVGAGHAAQKRDDETQFQAESQTINGSVDKITA
ncbi:hypothetical protein OH492_14005 [Vibrio chagasii]|nr:hypothetical protein [Vibrio chagasii]